MVIFYVQWLVQNRINLTGKLQHEFASTIASLLVKEIAWLFCVLQMDCSHLDGGTTVGMARINSMEILLAPMQQQQPPGNLSPGDSLPSYWIGGSADVCSQRSIKLPTRVSNLLIPATAAAAQLTSAYHAGDVRSDGPQSISQRSKLHSDARETGKIYRTACTGDASACSCR